MLSLLPLIPLTFSCSLLPPLAPEPPWVSLGPWDLPGASGSLGRHCKPSAAFGSLGSSVRLRDLASLAPPHPPHSLSLPLAPSCPLSLPMPSWVPGTFLGPQEALGAFTSLWQPWVFSHTQGPCFPCSPSSPSLSLTPSCPHLPLSLPGSPWALGTFLGPQEAFGGFASFLQPLAALGLQSDSGILLPLLPLNPIISSHSLSPPGPPWASLGPWDLPGVSGSLGSLHKPLAALGLQSYSGALLPLLPLIPLTFSHSLLPPLAPEPPWVSLGPWDLPGASGTLGRLCKLSAAFGSLGSSVRLRDLASLAPPQPHHFLSLPLISWASLGLPGPLGPSWGLRKPWEPSQAFGSLGSSVILRGLASLAPPHPPHSLSLPLAP